MPKDRLDTHPGLVYHSVLLPEILFPVFSLLRQVGILLDLGLVEPVDNGVFPLLNIHPLDLFLILEADLASRHATVLLQVRP